MRKRVRCCRYIPVVTAGPAGDPNTIVSITESGVAEGFCLITTQAAHGLTTGDIVVSGNSVEGYNKTHTIQTVPTPTTLQTDCAYDTDGTGGTWEAA